MKCLIVWILLLISYCSANLTNQSNHQQLSEPTVKTRLISVHHQKLIKQQLKLDSKTTTTTVTTRQLNTTKSSTLSHRSNKLRAKDRPTNSKTDSFIALVGQNFSLPCDISGEHKDDTIILILWYRNDSARPIYTVDARKTSLEEAPHSSDESVGDRFQFNIYYPISNLFIKTVERTDDAEYRCRIDYRIGRTVYRTMNLTVLDFPEDEVEESEYRKDPSSWPQYIAIVGTTTELPCNTTAPTKDDSVALILWYKGDLGHPLYSIDARSSDNLSDAKHFSNSDRARLNLTDTISILTLSPVREQDSGEYRCRVDFKRGRTINRFLKFEVIVPIKQLAIFSDNGHRIKDIGGPFNEGEPLNLTCEAQGGIPSPTVTWFRGSTIIDDTYFFSGDGSSLNILHLPLLKRDDLMMIVTCKASNNNITEPISHSIAIDLNLKPKEVRIIKPPGKLSIGRKVELVCQSTGSKPSAHIKWTIGGNTLEGLGESTSDDGSVTTSFLSFVPSTEDNAKKLICSAWNPMFTNDALTDDMILDISYAPIVFLAMGVSSRNEKILAGSDIFFECNIQANPSADKLGWTFNNRSLISNESSNVFIRNNSLLIKNVWKNHEGRYKCWASNSEGQGQSDSIDLNIQFAPVCSGDHKVYFGAAPGEQLEVICEVDADPSEVKFSWTFNETSSTDSVSLEFNQNGLKSTALYTPKDASDYGILYCWASNRVGRSKEPCRFYVMPAKPPDPPENCTIANITMDSLTVSCWPGYNGGLDQRYHLEMYLDNLDGLLIHNQSTIEYPFFVVKSLSSGNPYIINIYSTNAKGKSSSVVLRGSTQLQAQWHTTADSVDDIVVSPMILVLLGALGAFIILGCITMLVIKIKKHDHKGSDPSKIGMNTISDESCQQEMIMNQDCTGGFNYGPEIGFNHVTKFCGNHESGLFDEHKTVDAIIVPQPSSGGAPFHQICLDNQDLSITSQDNDKQTNKMLHVCHVGEGLIGANPLIIEHIYCHQDDRPSHSSNDIFFRDMVG